VRALKKKVVEDTKYLELQDVEDAAEEEEIEING
jgi:hypothetical protein